MEHSAWCDEKLEQIEAYTSDFTDKELRKFRRRYLKLITIRVDGFMQQGCETCKGFKETIEELVNNLKDSNTLTDDDIKNYKENLKKILKHLKKEHKIVEEREYIDLCLIIGVILGTAVSLIFGGTSVGADKYGLIGGIVAGFGVGYMLDQNAKFNGRLL